MSFLSWLRNPLANGARRARPRPPVPRFRPRLEALEGRCVPSTLKVTNTYDSYTYPGSLRYEIGVAKSGDTIVFDNKLDGQTITLTLGELIVSQNLTIKGPGAYQLMITSQPYNNGFGTENGSRIFEVDGAGTTVTISGLTMGDGGGTRIGGITSNPYDGYGGAVLDFGALTLSDCTLGGSTLVNYTAPTNYAEYGGAIANFGTMTVSGCDVSHNRTSGNLALEGGGIYNAGTLTVSGGDVSSNSASGGYGGGIYNAGAATVSNCTLSSDSSYQGGAIYNAGTATVGGCTLSGDSAYEGGGIYNAGTAGALTVSNSLFGSNTPDNIFGPYTDGGGNTFK
jgi:hypothetical protein